MESQTVKTSYGDVTLERLVHVYELYRASELRKQAKRMEFNQTEEGKALNRTRYKAYYERNREKVNEKNKARYMVKKAERGDTTMVVPLE